MASRKSSQAQQSKAAARAARAAALRAEQERAERKRRMLMIGAVVGGMAVLVAAIFAFTYFNQEDVTAAEAGGSEYGVTIGDADAPHEIVIYEDFLCPFCGQLEAETADELEELAADGKVLVEYRPFDLLSEAYGDYPVRAANAFAVVLEQEGPEVAKEYHDLLFENQPTEGGPYPSDDDLVALAVEAGADEDAVRPGIEGLEQEGWVQEASQEARDAGISSTPTVLLDGEVFTDGRTVEDLADNLIGAVE